MGVSTPLIELDEVAEIAPERHRRISGSVTDRYDAGAPAIEAHVFDGP